MRKIDLVNMFSSLVLILILSLGTACGLPLGGDSSTAADTVADISNPSPIHTEWAVPPVESQSPVLPTIADVVAAVKPSVVAIDTEVTVNMFRRSFTQEGAGSGWIIDKNGIIVTLDDGRTFTANPNRVVADPLTDIAVLYIDAENLPSANIGDSSELRVGD